LFLYLGPYVLCEPEGRAAPNRWDVLDKMDERPTSLNRGSDRRPVFIQNSNHRAKAGGRKLWIEHGDEQLVINVVALGIDNEVALFESVYAYDLDVLREVYGDKVAVMWGLVTEWS
jgi:hypothetical protein